MKLNLKKKLECTAMGFPMECTWGEKWIEKYQQKPVHNQKIHLTQ